MIDVVLFAQVEQMIVHVVRAKEFFKHFFRVCREFVLADELAIFQESLFKHLIPVLVINGAFLAYSKKGKILS